MDTPTIIIASGQFAALITLFVFVWRADKRSEKRTNTSEERANTRHAELVTQIGTFATILLQGQTHIQTQIVNLQKGQKRILIHISRLKALMDELKAQMSRMARAASSENTASCPTSPPDNPA